MKIFANIDRVRALNERLLAGLDERRAADDPNAIVGGSFVRSFGLGICSAVHTSSSFVKDLFVEFAKNVDVYLQYITMFEISSERMQYNLKNNKAFRNFVEFCAIKPGLCERSSLIC